MKATGEITGAKLKAEIIRERTESGRVESRVKNFWIVTVKIAAHHVDANEIEKMTNKPVSVGLDLSQRSLELSGGPA